MPSHLNRATSVHQLHTRDLLAQELYFALLTYHGQSGKHWDALSAPRKEELRDYAELVLRSGQSFVLDASLAPAAVSAFPPMRGEMIGNGDQRAEREETPPSRRVEGCQPRSHSRVAQGAPRATSR